MPLALMLLAGIASLIPARWNSGDARSLAVLEGGTVNCVVVESANWNKDLVGAAARRRIAVFGLIRPEGDAVEQARRAGRLKLSGVVLEGDFDPDVTRQVREASPDRQLAVVEMGTRARMRLDSPDQIVGTSQALWPGIQIEHGGGEATAGPTSNPWIHTNTGFLRFARASTDAAIWLGERPPAGKVFSTQRYGIAIADAAIAGARWLISLDEELERRLLAGDRKALASWRDIDSYARYFEEKPEWRQYRPYSQLALVQDTTSGGLLSGSILDMLAVQHTAAKSVPVRRLSAERLQGARVVLNIDAGAPGGTLREFARSGGVLVNPPAGWRFPAAGPEQMTPTRRQMDQLQPIWESAYNVTARKNFGVRSFNTASVLFELLAAQEGRSLLVHLLNYADYGAEDVTIQVQGKWRRARLYMPGAGVEELVVYPVADGTGIDIKRFGVVATVLVD